MQFPSANLSNPNKPQDPMQIFIKLMSHKMKLDEQDKQREQEFKDKMKLIKEDAKRKADLIKMKQMLIEQTEQRKMKQEQEQKRSELEMEIERAMTGADVMEEGIRSGYSDRSGRRPMPGENYPLTDQGNQMMSMMPAIRAGAVQGQNIPVNQVLQTQRAMMPEQAKPMNPLDQARANEINQKMKILMNMSPEAQQKGVYPGPARINIAEKKLEQGQQRIDLDKRKFGLAVQKFEQNTQKALMAMDESERNEVFKWAKQMSGGDEYDEEYTIRAIRALAILDPERFEKYEQMITTKERRFLPDKEVLRKPEQSGSRAAQYFK